MSVPLQICNGTDISGIILEHLPCLMGADFCVWCGICAKYLAFGTYPTSTVGALRKEKKKKKQELDIGIFIQPHFRS